MRFATLLLLLAAQAPAQSWTAVPSPGWGWITDVIAMDDERLVAWAYGLGPEHGGVFASRPPFDDWQLLHYRSQYDLDLLPVRCGDDLVAIFTRSNAEGPATSAVRYGDDPWATQAVAPAQDFAVYDVACGTPGTIWAATSDGVRTLDLVAGQWTPADSRIRLPGRSITLTPDGPVLGTDAGIFALGEDGWRLIGLADQKVRTLAAHPDGRLWASTADGTLFVAAGFVAGGPETAFQEAGAPPGVSFAPIYTDGRVYAATTHAVFAFDEHSWTQVWAWNPGSFTPLAFPDVAPVTDFAAYGDGFVVATVAGVWTHTGASNQESTLSLSQPDLLVVSDTVYAYEAFRTDPLRAVFPAGRVPAPLQEAVPSQATLTGGNRDPLFIAEATRIRRYHRGVVKEVPDPPAFGIPQALGGDTLYIPNAVAGHTQGLLFDGNEWSVLPRIQPLKRIRAHEGKLFALTERTIQRLENETWIPVFETTEDVRFEDFVPVDAGMYLTVGRRLLLIDDAQTQPTEDAPLCDPLASGERRFIKEIHVNDEHHLAIWCSNGLLLYRPFAREWTTLDVPAYTGDAVAPHLHDVAAVGQTIIASVKARGLFRTTLASPVATERLLRTIPFSAYPNPTTGLLRFDLPPTCTIAPCSIRVYDFLGRQVGSFLNPHMGANLSPLPAGIYLVRLTTKAGTHTLRVVKL